MEKRIIELTKTNNKYQCILCCEKDATVKMKINRVKYDDSITSIYVCDECLVQMQKDIEVVNRQAYFREENK